MLGKGRRFELADNGLQAFRQHKTVLITNPLTIHCVGSKDGIGAVLEQKKLNATARWRSNGVRLPCHLFTALYFSHGNAGFPSSQATPRQPTPQRVPRLPQSKKFRLMYRSLSTDWSNSRAIPEPVGSISIWTKCFFRIFTSWTRQTRVAKITSRVFERRSSVAPTNAFRCWRPNANQTPPTIPINTFRFFSLPWGRRSICCLLHRWIFLARIWSLKIKIWVFEVWLRKRNFYRRKRLDFILQGGKRGG